MSRSRFELRNCPVCGSSHSKLLFHQAFERLNSGPLLDGYDAVVCEDCGMVYADDIPLQSAFDEYYRTFSKYDYQDRAGKAPPSAEQRFIDTSKLLERFIPSTKSRIFEIGSASGQLLNLLRDRGFSNVLGSDPSPGCVEAARKLYDIPEVVCTLFDAPIPENPYDFIILIGVMEHIRDLDRAVSQLHRLLHPSGRIYLEVPDASKYKASEQAPFQEFSVEHINFFSPYSLANLMVKRGFRVVHTGRTIRPQYELTCPAAFGVFEPSTSAGVVQRDSETEAGLRIYVKECRAQDASLRANIDQALPAGTKVIVWGVGTQTLRLLANGGLDPSRIVAFVDSNPKYQNQQLRGVPVIAPTEIKHRMEPILISSRNFQAEICDQIRGELGLLNPVILPSYADLAR